MKAAREEKKHQSVLCQHPLRMLLQSLDKSHKADIAVYSSGHLNPANLYKPLKRAKNASWESANKPVPTIKEKSELYSHSVLKTNARKMIDALADFTVMTSLGPGQYPASPFYPEKPTGTPATCFSTEATGTDEGTHIKGGRIFPEIVTSRLGDSYIRVDPQIPETKVLVPKSVKTGRYYLHDRMEQFQFVPSYLAGITKKDQFAILKSFQKNIIRKNDMLEMNVMSGSRSVEKHEWKLTQALMKIKFASDSDFRCVQVCSDVLQDICQDSLTFCDILTEIKSEYDLYLSHLLSFQPVTQHKVMLAELQHIQQTKVKSQDVTEVKNQVLQLEQEARNALDKNEQLRNELKTKLSQPKPIPKDMGPKKKPTIQTPAEAHVTIAEQVQSKRCQALALWEEIKKLEKEIKETMTHVSTIHTIKECINETEAETKMLQDSNELLQKSINDIEININEELKQLSVSQETHAELWHLITNFLSEENDGSANELESGLEALEVHLKAVSV
ncbi:uncharacterized protein C6orf118 homolog [Protopterus annectens]|uniref:uncharacterized protein C6orf118 homolog n=1 Tax=Protopterus annectens TaxID=7888 RepID=UPI001CFC1C99|nr:uncharacterized protein C6orf118 homolog [Protopterus annectens]XP_043925495.1 uncharacterized protein C6orf118 homolog [Protopterus annectens]